MAWYEIILWGIGGLTAFLMVFGYVYDLIMKFVGAPVQGSDGFDNQNPN